MSKPPMSKQIANFFFDKFGKNPGNFLLVSGMIAWGASCVNQLVAVLINKKIPKEQKYFLIPQEITDGIVNVLLFAVFTRSFTRVGERLVETGRMLTPELREELVKKNLGEKLGKADFNIKETEYMQELSSQFDEDFSKKFNNFYKGASFVFSTIGSIISCDFVTPFVRNKIAAGRQKKALARDKELFELQKINTPILPAQNDITGPQQDKPETKLAYYSNTMFNSNGRMKI